MFKGKQNRIGTVTRVAFASGLVIVCLAAAFACADPMTMPSSDSSRSTNSSSTRSILSLRVAPRAHTVSAGSQATYRIRIRRGWRRFLYGQHGNHRIAASVQLRIKGALPGGVRASFQPRRTRTMLSRLTLRTGSAAPPGRYRLNVRARGHLRSISLGRTRLYHASASLVLIVTAPVPTPPVDLDISGNTRGLLAPGTSAPIEVRFTNPNDSDVTIDDLATTIEGINSPNATADLPCEDADFSVQQYSGDSQLRIPAASTHSLDVLGVPESQWPRIVMPNRAVNQDGCKGASLAIGFTATSTAGTP